MRTMTKQEAVERLWDLGAACFEDTPYGEPDEKLDAWLNTASSHLDQYMVSLQMAERLLRDQGEWVSRIPEAERN